MTDRVSKIRCGGSGGAGGTQAVQTGPTSTLGVAKEVSAVAILTTAGQDRVTRLSGKLASTEGVL